MGGSANDHYHLTNAQSILATQNASTSLTGLLTSTDWNTFNNKQASLGFTPENVANKTIDGTLAANSATLYPSESAVKTYADTKVSSNTAITGATYTKITYDTKGLVTSGATAALTDLSDVAVTSPVTNQHLVYNGASWVNQDNQVQVNGGAGVNYFLTATASGISTYDDMSKTPDTVAEVDESIVVNNNTLAFEGYISDVSLGGSQIDPGIWNFNFYTYSSSALGINTLAVNVYKRTSGGTETLLFSATSPNINITAVDLITITTVHPTFSINATDKLLFKIDASTTNAFNTTIHLVHSGTSHYSFINTPLLTRHNDLAGEQGGTSTERYHLTSAEYIGTGTGDFVRASSPNITTPTGIVKADIGLSNVNNTADTAKTITGDVTGTLGASTVDKINGTSLSGLTTGILKNTTSTGVPSIAVAADFPTLNQNTNGTAATFTGSLTGDVTSTAMATTIANNVVDNAKLAQMAANTIKGNNTGSTANAIDLTATQATAMLGSFVGDTGAGGTKGLVIAPATGDATKFLKGNGTWSSVTATSMAWTTITASNTTTVLTTASNRGILINGTVGGQKFQLPNATTMSLMDPFEFVNNSNVIIPVYNSASTLLGVIRPEQSVEIYPSDISTSAGVWLLSTYANNYDQQPPLFDDFISAGTSSGSIGNLAWTLTTGTVAYQVSANPRMGVVRLNTNTSNSGSGTLSLGTTSPIVLGGGRHIIEFYVNIPTLGGTGAAAFTAEVGLQDTTGSTETANGVYVSYSGTAAGTINWNCKTSSASTRTSTSSGTAAAANTWVKFTIVVNPAGTNVDYYVNNLFVAAITTNIPTTPIAPNIHLWAGATNTAAKSLDIDFYKLQTSSTTAR